MYTPTNWQTGDTITAEKMNNIEQGLVNAPNVAVVSLDAEGFNTGSKTFGFVVYATYDSGHWVLTNDEDNYWVYLIGFVKPNDRIIPPQYTIIPNDTTCPFFISNFNHGDVDVQTTGYIESQSLYFGYGSVVDLPTYRIYGDGSIKLIG